MLVSTVGPVSSRPASPMPLVYSQRSSVSLCPRLVLPRLAMCPRLALANGRTPAFLGHHMAIMAKSDDAERHCSGKTGRHDIVATTLLVRQQSTFILRSASHNRQVCTVWNVEMKCMLDEITSHHQLEPFIQNCAAVPTPCTEGRLSVIRAHVRHKDTFSAE